jgi:hypothetical protein
MGVTPSSGTPCGVQSLYEVVRWSSLRFDHRLLSRNPSGCNSFTPWPGGLRCASTTGYFRATLRVAIQHR